VVNDTTTITERIIMKAISGATYRHYKGGLYMVIMRVTNEADGHDCVVYASLKDAKVFVRSYDSFAEEIEPGKPRFTMEIPAQPSIGLAAVGYLWTTPDGGRVYTDIGEEFPGAADAGVRREALVRLSDAFAKFQMSEVQRISTELKHTM
jgi:hypothetical protein